MERWDQQNKTQEDENGARFERLEYVVEALCQTQIKVVQAQLSLFKLEMLRLIFPILIGLMC